MKQNIAFGRGHAGVVPRKRFLGAWLAAALGVALIIGVVFWTIWATTTP